MLEHISFRWNEIVTEQTVREFPSALQGQLSGSGLGRTFQQFICSIPAGDVTIVLSEDGYFPPFTRYTRAVYLAGRQAVFMVRLYRAYLRLTLEYKDCLEARGALTQELRGVFLSRFGTEPDLKLIGYGTACITPELVREWTEKVFYAAACGLPRFY